jgi:sodium/hydrogen exchanger-like protein 6/7
VAPLSIVKEKSYPTLNSILFGEGVVNDAVAILLFHAVEELILKEKLEMPEFTSTLDRRR